MNYLWYYTFYRGVTSIEKWFHYSGRLSYIISLLWCRWFSLKQFVSPLLSRPLPSILLIMRGNCPPGYYVASIRQIFLSGHLMSFMIYWESGLFSGYQSCKHQSESASLCNSRDRPYYDIQVRFWTGLKGNLYPGQASI